MVRYENPAKLFLENHDVTSVKDVIAYTDYLRMESGLSANPPINLQKIIDRFGMHSPKTIPLPQQQGTTVPYCGSPQILIHAGDIETRQKFSIAHELIELLFLELPGNIRFDNKKDNIFGVTEKERICQIAAANLLMPKDSFRPRALRMGIAFQSGELLAEEYQVSLIAALYRLTDMYPKNGAVVLWQMKNKPIELKRKVPKYQLEMPGFAPTNIVSPKLRVAWSYGNFRDIFIPLHKSIPEDSLVYKAWKSNQFTSGEEMIPFGRYNNRAIVECKPISIEGEKYILSLIR